jgi:hypothetical protein
MQPETQSLYDKFTIDVFNDGALSRVAVALQSGATYAQHGIMRNLLQRQGRPE